MLSPCRSLTLTSTAARAVASLAEDPKFHLSRVLEPGDLEIIHNPTIFHARSDIHDGEARATRPSVLNSTLLYFTTARCAVEVQAHTHSSHVNRRRQGVRMEPILPFAALRMCCKVNTWCAFTSQGSVESWGAQ